MNGMSGAIQIKGIRDSLLVTLGDGDWNELQDALLNQIDDQITFFKGARLALDVGNQALHAAEMGVLRDRLSAQGIALWAVISNSPTSEKTAQMLGLATRLPTPRPERINRPLDTNLPGEPAVLVRRTMRSGFKVSFHGHIVVMGDVNPGAEIVAVGNVLVWGRLRGVVHAGAEGDENAVVSALEMAPTQLRIAGIAAVPENLKKSPRPEIARIQDGQVVIESWINKEGGR